MTMPTVKSLRTIRHSSRNEWNPRIPLLITAAALLSPFEASSQQLLEEVVVTAERRQQSAQDLPTSVSVLSGRKLNEKGIDNINEIQNAVPGLAINTLGRTTFVNIRGVGVAQSNPTASSGVAYYTDGVLIPDQSFIGNTFYDIDGIEILRGPQGTLTGQNSTGGAIYVRTVQPSTEEFSGYLDQTIGDYSWYKTTAAINLPLSENTALRLSGIYDHRDSFSRNIGSSKSTPGDSEMYGFRSNLLIHPSDTVEVNIRGSYFNSESDHIAVKNRSDVVSSDPFTIEEDAASFLDKEGYLVSAEVRVDLPSDTQFRFMSSWQDLSSVENADGDRTNTAMPVPENLPTTPKNNRLYPGRVSRTDISYDAFISEFNFLSTHNEPLQWVVGGFYLSSENPVDVQRDNRNTTEFVSSSSDILLNVENTSQSLFGQINYEFSQSWELAIGARYTEDKQDLTRIALPGPPPSSGFPFTTQYDSSQMTGRISLQRYFNNYSMVYASVSKGYKAGGVNLLEFQPDYDPEQNWVYEVGTKILALNDQLRLTGAVYYSDYSDIQFLSIASIGSYPPLSLTQNAATAESYGAEMEATYVLNHLSVDIGVAYLDSEFAEDVFLNNAIDQVSELVPDGRTLPFAPTWTFNMGVQYDFPIGDMLFTPRIQYAYTSEQISTPFPLRETVVPSRNVLDIRGTLQVNEALSIEGFITNLADETYIASQLQSTTGLDGGFIYGAPRQIGIRAKLSF